MHSLWLKNKMSSAMTEGMFSSSTKRVCEANVLYTKPQQNNEQLPSYYFMCISHISVIFNMS